ncbi:unnamed protein product [Brassica rapa subsp. trilocularis]
MIQAGQLRVAHVSTRDQLADALMKPLPRNHIHLACSEIGFATTFSEDSLYFGGPLQCLFNALLKYFQKCKIHGFEEVMPGLKFGARNTLDEAAVLVKGNS